MKIVMWLSIMAVVALAVLNLTYNFGAEPYVAYPMVNQRITWEYAGK